jgi:ParB-like chromosome segregation protein Spo0J
VKCELVKLDPASIKPTQKDFNLDKVLTLVDSSVDKPIIVSVDGYVLDGHHRYLAELVKGKPHLVNMYQCSASINNLLHLVKDYKE